MRMPQRILNAWRGQRHSLIFPLNIILFVLENGAVEKLSLTNSLDWSVVRIPMKLSYTLCQNISWVSGHGARTLHILARVPATSRYIHIRVSQYLSNVRYENSTIQLNFKSWKTFSENYFKKLIFSQIGRFVSAGQNTTIR